KGLTNQLSYLKIVEFYGSLQGVGLAPMRRGISEDRSDQPALVLGGAGGMKSPAKGEADHATLEDRAQALWIEKVLGEECWPQVGDRESRPVEESFDHPVVAG